MNIFEKLGIIGCRSIDWDITPDLTFTMFESWGSRFRVRSLDERFYYFFIDNWQEPAKLCLMERGVKFARVLAEVAAPQELIDRCVAAQGKAVGLDKSYAIDAALKQWLVDCVLEANDASKVTLVIKEVAVDDLSAGLPGCNDPRPELEKTVLESQPGVIAEEDLVNIVKRHNFFESKYNPQGGFANYLVDSGDGLTVLDLATGLMWQRGGFNLTALRTMQKNVSEVNQQAYAGYSDWRLPTMEEALSLLEPGRNEDGLHLHPCFSKEQPFIFLANTRQPGGFWFMDFNQGKVYWASGVNPGGFGRFCRTA